MDGAAAARAERAAADGTPLACGAGCTGCCEELVLVFLPEAHAVARWLDRPENAPARRAFLDAYPAWTQRAGDAPASLAAAFAAGDEDAFTELHVAQWRRRLLCAFNRDGLCTIYPVRPMLCRNAHAAFTSAHCYGDDPSGEPVVHLRARAVEEFVDNVRAFTRAAHHALGGPRREPRALCDQVYLLLSSPRRER
jgi:Fe-S-cluster containining protein